MTDPSRERNGYTAEELRHVDDTAREFMGAMFGPRTPPAEVDAGGEGLSDAQRLLEVIHSEAHAAERCAKECELWHRLSRLPRWPIEAWITARLAEEKRKAAEGALRAHRCRPCGCAWCCANTPTDQRGETHRRTCQPHRADRIGKP